MADLARVGTADGRARHLRLVLIGTGLGAVVVFGALLRVWMITHAPLTSDQAIVGLMAREIINGHFSTFYWGQNYGGVEPFVAVPLVGFFGASWLTINLTSAILSALASVVVWRIGLRLMPAMLAIGVAVLTWVWPEVDLWASTREGGFRQVTLLCGLLIVLFVLRLLSARPAWNRRDGMVLGLVTGVGVWSSPEIIYFLVPAAVVLVARFVARPPARLVPRPGALVLTLIGLFVGAAPWLYTNARDGFLSLRNLPTTVPSTYGQRFDVFYSHVLPMLLGLRMEGAGAWVSDPTAMRLLYVVLLTLFVIFAVLVALFVPAGRLVVLVVVLFPFLYAIFPQTIFWNDARFALYLPPVLALTAGAAWPEIARAVPRISSAGGRRTIIVAIGVVATGFVAFGTVASAVISTERTFNVASLPHALIHMGGNPEITADKIVTSLQRQGISDGWANYWFAEALDVVSPRLNLSPPDEVRWLRAFARTNSGDAPWLVLNGNARDVTSAIIQFENTALGPTSSQLEAQLRALHVAYTARTAGILVVIKPARRVTPQELGFTPSFS